MGGVNEQGKYVWVAFVGMLTCLFGLVIVCKLLYDRNRKRKLASTNESIKLDELIATNTPMLIENQNEQDRLITEIDENIKIDRNDLNIKNEIGSGQFGCVYFGSLSSRNGRIETLVAIKKSSKDSNQKI